jgi:hypothetical protein
MGIRHLIDRRKTDRASYARHLKSDHSLPAEAVTAIDESGVDLREFHGEEHNNDAALGLGGDSHGGI